MYYKVKNIFFLLFFFIFVFLVTKYYFSEKNVISTNKSRSSYTTILNNSQNTLPLLTNDTKNVIVFIDDLENFKNKRKKRLWEKLLSNTNE